jgi:hypothetical protein
MEEPTCDLAPRQAAEPTSRRSALAALLGGALMLHEPAASEATKKAKRRKARRRRQRRNKAASLLKPISFEVMNFTDDTFSVEYGDSYPLKRCHVMKSIMLSRGTSGLLNTTISNGFLWIGGKYWIDVWNPLLYVPQVTVAVDGQPPGDLFVCQATGQVVHRAVEMNEGNFLRFSRDGLNFRVFRSQDTNYKVYELHILKTS